jgi:hypothetical protein
VSLVADSHFSRELLSSFWKISLPLKELWHANLLPPGLYLCANRRASVEMKACQSQPRNRHINERGASATLQSPA